MRRTLTKSLLFTLFFVGVFFSILTLYTYEKVREYEGRVYPNVYVNGKDFSGKSRKDINAYFKPLNKDLDGVSFSIAHNDSVATFSGAMIDLHYNSDAIAQQALMVGRSPHLPSRLLHIVGSLYNLNTFTFTHRPMFDLKPVDDYLAELDETYSIPAQDALFSFKNNRVTAFKPEKEGIRIDVKETRDDVSTYLLNPQPRQAPRFIAHTSILEPRIRTGDTNEYGIKEKIGEGSSNYSGSSAEREHNVVLSASKFHGVLIPPGKSFSYNQHLGDVSTSSGYKTAYVIKNGRTVLGDGGGVCQNSTTLFRAALNSGLPITERHAHAYRVKYYENDRKPGFDATIYSPTVDFKFKNDTPAHILIQAKVDQVKNIVTFEFYGTKDNRVVELSDARVYDFRPAPEALYQDDPTLKRGITKQVDWSAPGAKSLFTYKVIKEDGTVTQDRTFYSTYRPWQAVFLVGTAE